MAADYKQPANVEKRVRFFDGQYLLDQDFIDEQKYHIDRQRRHNRTLHIAGIADGLEVKPGAAKAGSIPVSVTAGTAVDQDGRQLVLAQDQTVDLVLSKFKSKTASIYIVYAETTADPQKAGGIESDSRWQEGPVIVAEVKGQAIKRDYPLLLLGELTLDGKGAITNNNVLVREYSGLRLPGPSSASSPSLRSDAVGRATLAGGLAVTGNVSIGTATPGALLHVKGGSDPTIKIQSDGGNEFSGRLALHQNNDSGADIYYDGTDTVEALRFDVLTSGAASPTALCISNKSGTVGNVGIGGTTPSCPLHVTTAYADWQARFTNGDANVYLSHARGSGMHINTGKSNSNARYALEVRNSSQTHLYVRDDGHVGIGTADPAAKLDVIGASSTTSIETAEVLRLRRPGVSGVKNSNSAGFSVGAFQTGSVGKARLDIMLSGAPVAANKWGGIPNETVMSLLANGHVGIGTTAPERPLHVTAAYAAKWQALFTNGNTKVYLSHASGYGMQINTGQTNSSSRYALQVKNSSQTHLYVREDGKVGIGTTDPQEALHVNGSVRGNQAGALRISSGTGYVDVGSQNATWSHFDTDRSRFYFNKGITVNSGLIGSYDENLSLQTAGTTRMTISNSNGRVGIGNTAPSYPLHVTTAKTNDWQARFSNGDANVYLSHATGYGMHINTGKANSSSRYGLEVRNSSQRHFYVRDDGYVQLTHGALVNEFSTDGSLGGNSDNAVPTEKAVRAYVEKRIGDVWNAYARHVHKWGASNTTGPR